MSVLQDEDIVSCAGAASDAMLFVDTSNESLFPSSSFDIGGTNLFPNRVSQFEASDTSNTATPHRTIISPTNSDNLQSEAHSPRTSSMPTNSNIQGSRVSENHVVGLQLTNGTDNSKNEANENSCRPVIERGDNAGETAAGDSNRRDTSSDSKVAGESTPEGDLHDRVTGAHSNVAKPHTHGEPTDEADVCEEDNPIIAKTSGVIQSRMGIDNGDLNGNAVNDCPDATESCGPQVVDIERIRELLRSVDPDAEIADNTAQILCNWANNFTDELGYQLARLCHYKRTRFIRRGDVQFCISRMKEGQKFLHERQREQRRQHSHQSSCEDEQKRVHQFTRIQQQQKHRLRAQIRRIQRDTDAEVATVAAAAFASEHSPISMLPDSPMSTSVAASGSFDGQPLSEPQSDPNQRIPASSDGGPRVNPTIAISEHSSGTITQLHEEKGETEYYGTPRQDRSQVHPHLFADQSPKSLAIKASVSSTECVHPQQNPKEGWDLSCNDLNHQGGGHELSPRRASEVEVEDWRRGQIPCWRNEEQRHHFQQHLQHQQRHLQGQPQLQHHHQLQQQQLQHQPQQQLQQQLHQHRNRVSQSQQHQYPGYGVHNEPQHQHQFEQFQQSQPNVRPLVPAIHFPGRRVISQSQYGQQQIGQVYHLRQLPYSQSDQVGEGLGIIAPAPITETSTSNNPSSTAGCTNVANDRFLSLPLRNSASSGTAIFSNSSASPINSRELPIEAVDTQGVLTGVANPEGLRAESMSAGCISNPHRYPNIVPPYNTPPVGSTTNAFQYPSMPQVSPQGPTSELQCSGMHSKYPIPLPNTHETAGFASPQKPSIPLPLHTVVSQFKAEKEP